MKIRTNQIFDDHLRQLGIDYANADFSLPDELKQLISGDIVEQNDLITLTSLTTGELVFLKTVTDTTGMDLTDETGTESFANHFHVEDYLSAHDRENLKHIISAGLTTLKLLVDKFQKAGKSNIQFDLSFETIALGQQLAKKMNIEDDEHYNGCRISFHKIRTGQSILTEDLNEYKFNGIITIEI